MKNIRIVNDRGSGRYTKLLDVETGAELEQQMRVSRIEIDATEYVKATLHVELPAIDVVAHAETKRTAHIILDPDDPESVEQAIMAIRDLAAGGK